MSRLPAQIRAKMRNSIQWERFAGQDGHADEVYAAPVAIDCWIETKGGSGGLQRKQGVGITEFDPRVDVYMDAQDIDPSTVTLRDRFTYVINGQPFKTQPDRIDQVFGPDASAWLTVVTL